jgi:hypothetical protein
MRRQGSLGLIGLAAVLATALFWQRMPFASVGDPHADYMKCLNESYAQPRDGGQHAIVRGYYSCGKEANAFRMEMADKGIAANRIEPLVYRINEVAYALYMGIDFRDTVGCLAKQVNKPLS